VRAHHQQLGAYLRGVMRDRVVDEAETDAGRDVEPAGAQLRRLRLDLALGDDSPISVLSNMSAGSTGGTCTT
jgi:hypothetical protein